MLILFTAMEFIQIRCAYIKYYQLVSQCDHSRYAFVWYDHAALLSPNIAIVTSDIRDRSICGRE